MRIKSAIGCVTLLITIIYAKPDVSHLLNKEHHHHHDHHHHHHHEQTTNTTNTLTVNHNNNNNGRLTSIDGKQWDLRNNIPGEPEIDYPVYSEAPITSFECKDRHDGYYADIESRCQLFHVCANTDLTEKRFRFLCPNGTVFSQQLFVCDWYTNVNCPESGKFYVKNKELGKKFSNHKEMIAEVQRMFDYTLKRLIETQVSADKQSKDIEFLRKTSAGSEDINSLLDVTSRPFTHPSSTPTSEQTFAPIIPSKSSSTYSPVLPSIDGGISSTPSSSPTSTHTPYPSISSQSSSSGFSTTKSSISTTDNNSNNIDLPDVKADVYINNLGELSTDVGSGFDLNAIKKLQQIMADKKASNDKENIDALSELWGDDLIDENLHLNRLKKSDQTAAPSHTTVIRDVSFAGRPYLPPDNQYLPQVTSHTQTSSNQYQSTQPLTYQTSTQSIRHDKPTTLRPYVSSTMTTMLTQRPLTTSRPTIKLDNVANVGTLVDYRFSKTDLGDTVTDKTNVITNVETVSETIRGDQGPQLDEEIKVETFESSSTGYQVEPALQESSSVTVDNDISSRFSAGGTTMSSPYYDERTESILESTSTFVEDDEEKQNQTRMYNAINTLFVYSSTLRNKNQDSDETQTIVPKLSTNTDYHDGESQQTSVGSRTNVEDANLKIQSLSSVTETHKMLMPRPILILMPPHMNSSTTESSSAATQMENLSTTKTTATTTTITETKMINDGKLMVVFPAAQKEEIKVTKKTEKTNEIIETQSSKGIVDATLNSRNNILIDIPKDKEELITSTAMYPFAPNERIRDSGNLGSSTHQPIIEGDGSSTVGTLNNKNSLLLVPPFNENTINIVETVSINNRVRDEKKIEIPDIERDVTFRPPVKTFLPPSTVKVEQVKSTINVKNDNTEDDDNKGRGEKLALIQKMIKILEERINTRKDVTPKTIADAIKVPSSDIISSTFRTTSFENNFNIPKTNQEMIQLIANRIQPGKTTDINMSNDFLIRTIDMVRNLGEKDINLSQLNKMKNDIQQNIDKTMVKGRINNDERNKVKVENVLVTKVNTTVTTGNGAGVILNNPKPFVQTNYNSEQIIEQSLLKAHNSLSDQNNIDANRLQQNNHNNVPQLGPIINTGQGQSLNNLIAIEEERIRLGKYSGFINNQQVNPTTVNPSTVTSTGNTKNEGIKLYPSGLTNFTKFTSTGPEINGNTLNIEQLSQTQTQTQTQTPTSVSSTTNKPGFYIIQQSLDSFTGKNNINNDVIQNTIQQQQQQQQKPIDTNNLVSFPQKTHNNDLIQSLDVRNNNNDNLGNRVTQTQFTQTQQTQAPERVTLFSSQQQQQQLLQKQQQERQQQLLLQQQQQQQFRPQQQQQQQQPQQQQHHQQQQQQHQHQQQPQQNTQQQISQFIQQQQQTVHQSQQQHQQQPQQQQQSHQNIDGSSSDRVVVNIVPAYNYYLNDAGERDSYMDALTRGIITSDERNFGSSYNPNPFNQVQTSNTNYFQGPTGGSDIARQYLSPSGGSDISRQYLTPNTFSRSYQLDNQYKNNPIRRNDDTNNNVSNEDIAVAVRSSYHVPLGSVGKLPCDSDSVSGRRIIIKNGCINY